MAAIYTILVLQAHILLYILHKILQFIIHAHHLSPSRRREAPCEGTNSPRLFTPGETKALAKSKVHQISRA
jgi:hypothetical protein